MRIKRFAAPSIQEAKEQIIRELGVDAIILGTRQVKKRGFWGWLGFSEVEVTAAIDTPQEAVAREIPQVRPAADSPEPVPPWAVLEQDLADTKKLLESVSKRLTEQPTKTTEFAGALGTYHEYLISLGIDASLVSDLCQELQSLLPEPGTEDVQAVHALAKQVLEARLSPYQPRLRPSDSRRIVSLVGPTGVGKTTTIAKLAAAAVLREQEKVAFVTFDTFRVAAVEQLRTYGEILGAPVEVVLTPAEMRRAFEDLAAYDVIFVDSVGRSQQNKMQLTELKAFLDTAGVAEVFLTISSTTQYEIMQEIVSRYQATGPVALVITKIDEATRLGPVLNLLLETKLPVAYVTNGQNVPDDLLTMSPRDFVQLLLGEVKS